ncbi:MAG: hypothetical protein NZ699_07175 [Roseiflexus sp.]|nr:hypothetical protein [Roseiflexus sp.]MCS7288899.1 hypothetical protein [Roseiflexus sp.]MDW8146837.1 hypothetical protein [Roseiflexaceae bacterium]
MTLADSFIIGINMYERQCGFVAQPIAHCAIALPGFPTQRRILQTD